MMFERSIPHELRTRARAIPVVWIGGTPTVDRASVLRFRELLEELQPYHEVNWDRWYRASGLACCTTCGKTYFDHRTHYFPFHQEIVDCQGNIWHL